MQMNKNTQKYNFSNFFNMFDMIDEPLKINLIKNFIMAILTLVIGIVTAIMSRSFTILLLFIVISLTISSISFYQALKYLDGDVLRYTGSCIKRSPRYVNKKFERKYIILKLDEETLLKIYNDKLRKKYNVGDVISVYIPSSALYQINDNTYASNAVYYSYAKRTNIGKEADDND